MYKYRSGYVTVIPTNTVSVNGAYDISTATYVQNFSIGSQETAPTGMSFNNDGTKMYVTGYSGDDVNEYSLSTAFDVSTASYVQNFLVRSQDTSPMDMSFNNDGSKMFVIGLDQDYVSEYNLTSLFDISTASYAGNAESFYMGSHEARPQGLTFNNNGTKMYIIGTNNRRVNEYNLSTAFDVSTASIVQLFSINAQETSPRGIIFNNNGTKMFIVGSTGDDVNEYNLSTSFDVSTASYTQNFSVAAQEPHPNDVSFNNDGTKMFVLGFNNRNILEYSLDNLAVQSVCVNDAITNITFNTTGATGIGTATNLPTGVTAAWSSNVLTISGTPSVAGTFSYSVPLTGGCGTVNATGTITVNGDNTAGTASSTPTLCVNTALTNITHSTTVATGISDDGVAAANGLPGGVSASWSGDVITISGTPTASGTFNYTIPLSGGCGSVNATGTITVTGDNTAGTASSTPTICVNTALTDITIATTGATGIGTATDLPAGVTASWATDVITITGTPTAAGTFNYSIPLTGGCGSVNATGTITVSGDNTAGTASSTPTLCVNTALTDITIATTGATGIGTATDLPAGVTASWATDVITITGTPTAAGTFNYSIPLTGGCGSVNATGTITVSGDNTAGTASSTPTLCVNTALTDITIATTGATGIGTATDLPAGVTASWASDVITITGTPTAAGTFNYSIPLTGGCGTINATGTITVGGDNTAAAPSTDPTLCVNTALTDITIATTGATGIGTATDLPAGVTASWASDVITITGTPTAVGTYNYSIPLTGGCGTVNATGTITVTDISAPTAGAITQPTCAVATGSFTISSFDATSTYTFTPSGPTVDGSGVVTIASGATYTFTETNAAGCISAASLDVVIDAQPATPSAPVAGTITQPTCATATGSFTIASFESTSTYTFTPSGPTVDGTTGEVTLAAGATYTFTETNAAGCISAASLDVVIDAQPATPSAPVAGTITQPTCAAATASFTIASFDATSTYTFTPSGPTVDGTTGEVTLAAGATYTFTETNAAGCISAASLDVVIDAEPNCTDTDGDGIPDVTDLDDDNDGILDRDEEYSCSNSMTVISPVTPSPAEDMVPIASSIGTPFSWGGFTTELTTLSGTINTAIGFPGGPGSSARVDFSPNVAKLDFLVGDMDVGEVVDIRIYNELGILITDVTPYLIESTVNQTITTQVGQSARVIDGNQITGGTYVNYTRFNLTNIVVSRIEFDFVSRSGSGGPDVRFINACILLDTDGDGIPNYLDLDSDNDGIADIVESGGTDANGDGLVDNFTDTDNDGLHDPYDADNGGTTVVPVDTDLDGVADHLDLDADNDGIYDVVEGGDGASDTNGDGVVDSNDTGFADANNNGMADNTESTTEPDSDTDGIADYLELDSDNDGCNDVAEAGYTDANGDGILGAATPTFNANGTVDTTGTSSGGYNTPLDIDGNSVADYTEAGPNNASAETQTACDSLVWNGTTYTTSGTYTYTTTNMSGCDSVVTLTLTINTSPSAPVAGTITQPTCAVATASFTIASFESTSTYTFTPSGPTVDGTTGEVTLAAGATYTFTETNAAGCISAASLDVVIDAQPATPSAPVAGTITQPTCAVATGSFTIASFESTSTYTFTPSGPTVDGTTGEVTLAAGATYTFTETNAAGCVSAASLDVVIDAQPATPSAPVAGTITQPTCAVATASFTIASFESTSTYTFTPSGPTVDGTTGEVTLAAGATYTFTETNAAGCISAASLDVVIDAQPATPKCTSSRNDYPANMCSSNSKLYHSKF